MNDPTDLSDAESARSPERGDASRSRDVETTDSPCVGVCSLNAAGVYCVACQRTMDEIQRWGAMSDAERRIVLDRLQP